MDSVVMGRVNQGTARCVSGGGSKWLLVANQGSEPLGLCARASGDRVDVLGRRDVRRRAEFGRAWFAAACRRGRAVQTGEGQTEEA